MVDENGVTKEISILVISKNSSYGKK
jgi:hypothetical protein